MFGEIAIIGNDLLCFFACCLYQAHVLERFHAEVRDTPLFTSEQITGSASFQIALGEFETIRGLFECFESLEGYLSFAFRQQEAARGMRRAHDSSA